MNAIESGPLRRQAAAAMAAPVPTPPPPRFIGGLTAAIAIAVLALACLWWLASTAGAMPALAALRRDGLIPVALAALSLALAGLLGTWIMVKARARASLPAPNGGAEPRHWLPRALRGAARSWRIPGDPSLIGRASRWPQAIAVSGIAAAGAAAAWLSQAAGGNGSVPPAFDIIPGGVALVLAFPLLIVERWIAGLPDSRLPEAAALRTLLLAPVLVLPAAGLARIGMGLGIPFAGHIDPLLAIPLTAIATELTLRAWGRCFLPPPPPEAARAAVNSVLARILAEGLSGGGFGAPIGRHLGLDFSRGWALTFIRSAIPPVALMLTLLVWAMSGVVLVDLDRRAVYERFGAPAAVLQPGLNAILPWPMGRVRWVEFGTLHEISLSGHGDAAPAQPGGAEDRPPPEADRLWEQAHPGEQNFLIASEAGGRQSFQTISADLRLRYRVGLTDTDARKSVYSAADPETLLRALAGRTMAGFFARQTLDTALGENREAMAERLRASLQNDLDAAGTGIELRAVAIEAIHPPAGAAEAYHAVQAAEILAQTSISAERGRAVASMAKAHQYAADIGAQATAAGAEMTGAAAADLIRFTADQMAAREGGEAFLLERRLTAIGVGLAKSRLTILDHRIPADSAPVLDFRPFAPAARADGSGQD